jgi:hypothetical protein
MGSRAWASSVGSRPSQELLDVEHRVENRIRCCRLKGERRINRDRFHHVIVVGGAPENVHELLLIVADHMASMARATMPAPKPDVLAEPKSSQQAGFPNQMYKWVVPADNPSTPAKIALGEALS